MSRGTDSVDPALRALRKSNREARGEERAEARATRRRRRDAWMRRVHSVARLLPLPVACILGECVGLVVYLASGWMRRQTLTNLELALGSETTPAQRRRVARRCYRYAGRGLLAWLVMHRMGHERALARVTVEYPEGTREALDGGAIVLSAHFGLFELGGTYIGRRHAVRPVGSDAGEGDATSVLISVRNDMNGQPTIEKGNPREILKELKGGGRVGMLLDQDIRNVNGAFVPYFGRPAHTPIGPATFAVRMKVPLVYITTEWVSLTRHRITFGPVLRAREDLPHDDAVLELTARATKAVEDIVRRRPGHWLWMHDRWRTKPEDAPDAPRWPVSDPGEAP